jgi:hypothetical protein
MSLADALGASAPYDLGRGADSPASQTISGDAPEAALADSSRPFDMDARRDRKQPAKLTVAFSSRVNATARCEAR